MSSSEEDIREVEKNIDLNSEIEKTYRLTRFIITFAESDLTSIDIKTFMEMGTKIFRFKIPLMTKSHRIKLLNMIEDAKSWCCAKYEVSAWPITLSIDLPNALIRTGIVREELSDTKIEIKENWVLELTSDTKFWNKCDGDRVFIDDPYILKDVKVGTQITLNCGSIVMICKEKVNDNTVKCKVIRGDVLESHQFVCVRGIKHVKPILSKVDRELIEFAKEYKLDMITVNSVRWASTLKMIKKTFQGESFTPLLMSSICEQEGLNNIDDIIENSDCILLAREFLAYEIDDPHKMTTIQLQVSAKCRKVGKPFFISGNVLDRTLYNGAINGCELSDITNAVMQGAGFLMRNCKDPSYVLKAIKLLHGVSIVVESIISRAPWRLIDEIKMPVNAAEACILASAVTAQQTDSKAIVVPTVTGRTAIQLSHLAPAAVILSVSTNTEVVRHLHVYRGIIPILYDKPALRDYHEEMKERVKFAVAFGIKYNILSYGQNYVEIKKSLPSSAYCDSVGVFSVVIEENTKTKEVFWSVL